MNRALPFVVLAFVCACGDSGRADGAGSGGGVTTYTDNMPDDLPAGGCRASSSGSGGDCDAATTTTTDTAGNSDNGCEASEDCQGAGACVATWEDEVRGPFECRFACIPSFDDASWCRDDASCCDAGATCTARGYCVILDAEGDSGSTSAGDESSTGMGTTGSTGG